MKLRNCPICGKLFTDAGLGICPRCYDKRREEEKKIMDLINAEKDKNASENSEE